VRQIAYGKPRQTFIVGLSVIWRKAMYYLRSVESGCIAVENSRSELCNLPR